jgi:putative (di)nucleoside polyphosphate hydrolase
MLLWQCSKLQLMEENHPASPLLTPPPDPLLYRPNVAAILRNDSGLILIAERLGMKDSWQFPQGGVDDGEDFEKALYREIQEEIGVKRKLIRVVERRQGYRYRFAKGRLKYGVFGGQEQTYYLCDFLGTDKDINLDQKAAEFGRYRWVAPTDFQLKWVPRFKQPTYIQVFHDFFGVDLH